MIKDTKDVMVGTGVADMPSHLNTEAIKVVAGKPLQNNYAYVMPHPLILRNSWRSFPDLLHSRLINHRRLSDLMQN